MKGLSAISRQPSADNNLLSRARLGGVTFLRSPLTPLLKGGIKLFFLLTLGLSLFALANAQEVPIEQRVFEVAQQLRCPTCRAESVAGSSADISLAMRELIKEKLEAGQSEEEILAFFQARYGDWILLEPPKRGLHLLVWVLPMIAGGIGLLALVFYLRRWTLESRKPLEVEAEDVKRVHQEMHSREGGNRS